jgi:hypothetical protein
VSTASPTAAGTAPSPPRASAADSRRDALVDENY